MKLSKILLILFGAIVGVCLFGCLTNEWFSRRKHAQEIENAYNTRLLPAAVFIESFVEREHRLPADTEFEAAGWPVGNSVHADNTLSGGITIYRERGKCVDNEWGTPGKDFVLETSVPDWNLYYRSWDKRRIEANWP